MSAPSFEQSYAGLPERFYARVYPESVSRPSLLKLNEPLAEQLGLDIDWLQSGAGVAMLCGNRMPDGAEPLSMAYAGHQFGNWVPQLGDGRAHLIGEIRDGNGTRFDLHLKGSGRTPFSRNGDGKAALGPVLREYIVSEAFAGLGIPTTRALAAVLSGDAVYREQALPGAVLARVAQSHVRVGTFQYFYARDDQQAVKLLADYIIERHYPEAAAPENSYLALFEATAMRQAELIAQWMGAGFIHGVMNTDNMQVAGETIDFGPCAFMDAFHRDKVFSSIDRYGRYAWDKQPGIAGWNLARLAETLLGLIDDNQQRAIEQVESVLSRFHDRFQQRYEAIFSARLGLPETGSHGAFIEATLSAMQENSVDFTLFFRRLTQLAAGGETDGVIELFGKRDAAIDWLGQWQQQRDAGAGGVTRMRESNPVYIARNHRVEEAIAAAYEGDFKPFDRLIGLLANPFEEQADCERFELPPEPHEEVQQTFCGT